MGAIKMISLVCMMLSFNCSFKKLPKVNWQITYRKVEYFFGGELLRIGTDSCYFESQIAMHINPPIVRWHATKKELRELYKLIEKYKLQDGNLLTATVTEEPFESLELVQNDSIIFSITRHQQTMEDCIKFDELVRILKAFALK